MLPKCGAIISKPFFAFVSVVGELNWIPLTYGSKKSKLLVMELVQVACDCATDRLLSASAWMQRRRISQCWLLDGTSFIRVHLLSYECELEFCTIFIWLLQCEVVVSCALFMRCQFSLVILRADMNDSIGSATDGLVTSVNDRSFWLFRHYTTIVHPRRQTSIALLLSPF